METDYTLREFIRMTPPQKMRLQQRDPAQYEKLRAAMEKNFSKETDHEALTSLNKKGN